MASKSMEVQVWPIERLVFYARNPRKNDAANSCLVSLSLLPPRFILAFGGGGGDWFLWRRSRHWRLP